MSRFHYVWATRLALVFGAILAFFISGTKSDTPMLLGFFAFLSFLYLEDGEE